VNYHFDDHRPQLHSKSQREIQRAHDILHYLGTPEAPPLFNRNAATACHAAHDALAWVLGFPCGASFQTNLDASLEELRRQGFEEIDVGNAISTEEARKRGLL
jgi:deoxyribose-phosphate aldolase